MSYLNRRLALTMTRTERWNSQTIPTNTFGLEVEVWLGKVLIDNSARP
jgi:hypothetical protein